MVNPKAIRESVIEQEADLSLVFGGTINKVFCKDTKRSFYYSEDGDTVDNEVVYQTASGGLTRRVLGAKQIREYYVCKLSDLPAPVLGVITIPAGVDVKIVCSVDLGGNRLEFTGQSSLLGISSETSFLTSTGLVGALITTSYSLPIQNITIHDVSEAFDIDGLGTAAIDWYALNLMNIPNIGTVKNVANFIYGTGTFISSAGLKLDGTVGTVSFQFSLFSHFGGSTAMEVLATCIITRRFRVVYCSFITSGAGNSIKVNAGATIPIDQFILNDVNFGGGATNYIGGVSSTDNIASFRSCKGISNSATTSQYYMVNNATATTITVQGTFYKIAGTTIDGGYIQRFTNTNNRATYTGAINGIFKVDVSLSANSGNNQLLIFKIYKNGLPLNDSEQQATTSGSGRSENVHIHTVTELATNDYIEVRCTNNTATTSITATEVSVIVGVSM